MGRHPVAVVSLHMHGLWRLITLDLVSGGLPGKHAVLEEVLSIFAVAVIIITFMLLHFNAPLQGVTPLDKMLIALQSWSVRPVLSSLWLFTVLTAVTTQNCVWWSWSWCTTWCLYECATWSLTAGKIIGCQCSTTECWERYKYLGERGR
jgi:hypothetical protein